MRLDLAASPEVTRYGWELNDHRNGREDTNVLRQLHRKPWVRGLMGKIRAWSTCEPRQCARLTR